MAVSVVVPVAGYAFGGLFSRDTNTLIFQDPEKIRPFADLPFATKSKIKKGPVFADPWKTKERTPPPFCEVQPCAGPSDQIGLAQTPASLPAFKQEALGLIHSRYLDIGGNSL